MHKFSNDDCKFFGARTPEKQESTDRCRTCNAERHDLFVACTKESAELIGTSVLVDQSITSQNGNESFDVSFKHSNWRTKRRETKMADETPIQQQPIKPKVQTTAGVLGIAKTMIAEGKSTEEIMAALITAYQRAGKTPRQAKHNAQSCLFNARKKIKQTQEKTGNPTLAESPGTIQSTEKSTQKTGDQTDTIETYSNPPIATEEVKPADTIAADDIPGEFEQQVDGEYTDDGRPLGTQD